MFQFFYAVALVPFLVGPAVAEDCLPDPTVACLQAIALDALIDDFNTTENQTDDVYKMVGWNNLESDVTEYLATFAAAGNKQAVDQIIKALLPDRLQGMSMRIALAAPDLMDVPAIGDIVRSAALNAEGPGYGSSTQAFEQAIEVLMTHGMKDIAKAKAIEATSNYFALQAQHPDENLFSEKAAVVGALLSTGEIPAAQAFLEKAEPEFKNAYQWMVLAKAMVGAGDCDGAMALTQRVPENERTRMGSEVLKVVYQCRGLGRAIIASNDMPDQELGMLVQTLVGQGKFDDAMNIASVMKARQSGWEDSIRRGVFQAELDAGAFEAAHGILLQQTGNPYELARSRIDLSMAMARAGKGDTVLLKEAIADIRHLDPKKVDPYSMADMMLMAGFAQTWLDVSGAEFLSLDDIEAQFRHLSPDVRDDPFGQLDASEEGMHLGIATVALAEAMGQHDHAAAFQAAALPDICERSDGNRVDCMVAVMDYIGRFAAPGRMGDLPSRAWALAAKLPDTAARGRWAWRISWYLKRPD